MILINGKIIKSQPNLLIKVPNNLIISTDGDIISLIEYKMSNETYSYIFQENASNIFSEGNNTAVFTNENNEIFISFHSTGKVELMTSPKEAASIIYKAISKLLKTAEQKTITIVLGTERMVFTEPYDFSWSGEEDALVEVRSFLQSFKRLQPLS